jgi:hypothetical protein
VLHQHRHGPDSDAAAAMLLSGALYWLLRQVT